MRYFSLMNRLRETGTCFPFWVSGVKRPLPREYPHHPPERDERERTRERERERKRIRESEEEHKGEGERKREKNNERESTEQEQERTNNRRLESANMRERRRAPT